MFEQQTITPVNVNSDNSRFSRHDRRKMTFVLKNMSSGNYLRVETVKGKFKFYECELHQAAIYKYKNAKFVLEQAPKAWVRIEMIYREEGELKTK